MKAPLLLLAAFLTDQRDLVAPPIITPSPEMTRALAKDGFMPAPLDVVQRAADCHASHQLYFLVEGDWRIDAVTRALNLCWKNRKVTSNQGITIRRWSLKTKQPIPQASTLKAVMIRTALFTQLALGPDLGSGD